MTRAMRVGLGFYLASACLVAGFAQARAQAPAAPPPNAAARGDEALPHDSHNGVVVSVKPLTDTALGKEKFGKANPLPVGILPVEVFLRNDTAQPIHLDLSTVQLAVHTRGGHTQDIQWLTPAQVASAVAHPNGPSSPRPSRLPPLGLPTAGDAKADKLAAILQPLALDADIMPPESVLHGFLFFDLNRDLALAEDASLYVPDVSTIPSNNPLMFFEVPLSGPVKP